ncbi:TrkA family potassium uptake protein [Synechococcus sp. RedBA-s]|uniref:potassium channel family protein n=1 Tax=Synechococcus sp. RedBA-s TaxID=2823741 RepID=UPI0020CE256F|nr:TrkA family potassium uptake protein [Synechococcus sp. RedBA-s]MCP9801657.1 TrkA family potassium uptake protein [Synechococcus sp. RedBA-s]
MTNWWRWQGAGTAAPGSFAVIGVGRFDTAVCKELVHCGAEVLAIDRDQHAIDVLRQVDPAIEARALDCTDEEALREAGVLDLTTVVVGISEPIAATLIVKDSEGSRVKQMIARATSDLHEKMMRWVGADKVVFPSLMQGEQLARQLERPNLLERLRLDDRNSIEQIKVPQAFIGRSLRDLNLRKNYEVSVLAAGPENRLSMNPPASHVLSEGDLQVVMGTVQALKGLPQL